MTIQGAWRIALAAVALAAGVVAGRERPTLELFPERAARPPAARADGIDLERLRRGESSTPQADPFARKDFEIRRAKSPSANIPPKPAAPPLPFQYFGRLIENGKTEVFVLRGEELLSIAPGAEARRVPRRQRERQEHCVHLPAAQDQADTGSSMKQLATVLGAAVLAGCAGNTLEQSAALIGSGNEEQGLERLEKAVRANPNDVELRNYYLRHRAVAVQRYVQTGDNARAAGAIDAAEVAYQPRAALRPGQRQRAGRPGRRRARARVAGPGARGGGGVQARRGR